MIERRGLLIGAAALGAALSVPAFAVPATDFGGGTLREAMAALERKSGGRLGVALLDTAGGRRFGWRADERFPLCSTFKFLLVSALLQRVDRGEERLDRGLAIPAVRRASNSPFADSRAGRHASLAELCAAAISLSDNEAANLLLPAIGGADGLTRFARSIGDPVSRLDRSEPAMSQASPRDPRDTTSPRAMCDDFERVLLGPVLRPQSRARLIDWLVGATTGVGRLKAGLPAGWRVGHKTGTGSNGTANDVAIVWPAGKSAPMLIAAYLTGSTLAARDRDSILAGAARAIAARFG